MMVGGNSPSRRPIRIAGASGSASDRRHAMASFAQNYTRDPVDVIINDYLSEANMASAAGRKFEKSKNATSQPNQDHTQIIAFEPAVLQALELALDGLARHNIKVVVNAGASDTKALHGVICEMVTRHQLDSQVKVAWIEGDEVLPAIQRELDSGQTTFKSFHTDTDLREWKFEPIYAQAYLGGQGIAEALRQGAQIVVCGRVADASPVIGAACWWHDWRTGDFDLLANAFVAGHMIECSSYVTGGNFSGFKSLQSSKGGWTDIGFPIAEISAQGQVVITKQMDSGGVVSVDTCSSQLLYEIQGPWYFNSDVTAVMNDVWFEQLSENRVALHGISGLPPPPTTKVGITAPGGYQAEAYYFLTGLDIDEKARMLEDQLRKLLVPYSSKFTTLNFSVLGAAKPDADSQNAATALFRIFVQARQSADIATSKFLKPILDNIMQGYPGATFHLDFRQGMPKQYFEYFVTLLPQSEVKQVVHLEGKAYDIPPPTETRTYPRRQPSHDAAPHPIDQSALGPTKRVPLGTIVHARSGDKGPDCNCGFWVRTPEEYGWLKSYLSIATIQNLLGKEFDTSRRPSIEIERFELPQLRGVHFLFRNLLDRGVTSTGSVDFLGKNCAEFLRSRYVDIPIKFLARGRI